MIDEYVVRFKAETQQFNNSLNDMKAGMKEVTKGGADIKELSKDIKQLSNIKSSKGVLGTLSKAIRDINRELEKTQSTLNSKSTRLNEIESRSMENQLKQLGLSPADAMIMAQGFQGTKDWEKVAEGVTLPKDVVPEWHKLNEELADLSEKKFGLQEINQTLSDFSDRIKSLNPNANLKDMDVGKLQAFYQELSDFAKANMDVSPQMAKLFEAVSKNFDFPEGTSVKQVWQDLVNYLQGTVKSTISNTKRDITNLGKAIDQTAQSQNNLRKQSKEANKETEKSGKSASKASNAFTKFFSRVKTMILYRAIRSALSAISNAMKEGIQNLYQYSKATDGVFSGAMDTFASYSLYLKNSLATVLAPLIQSLIPVFKRLVEWIA